MITRLRALAGRRPELLVLSAFALVSLILLAVLKLGSEVMEGDTRTMDVAVLTDLRHATDGNIGWRPELRAIMLDLTALGDEATLVLIVAAVVGFLALSGKRRSAVLLAAATLSGVLVTTAIKIWFDRPRPDVVVHLTSFGGASFPSGHAMNSAVAYLTMAGLVARVTPILRLRVYILCCAVTLTFVIGVSRLYLGVHWPTDVLAGWAAGAGWAMLCWTIAWWLERRRAASRS